MHDARQREHNAEAARTPLVKMLPVMTQGARRWHGTALSEQKRGLYTA